MPGPKTQRRNYLAMLAKKKKVGTRSVGAGVKAPVFRPRDVTASRNTDRGGRIQPTGVSDRRSPMRTAGVKRPTYIVRRRNVR